MKKSIKSLVFGLLLGLPILAQAQELKRNLDSFDKIIVSPKINLILQKGDQESIRVKYANVSSDKINIDWVLGNKLLLGSVNANREHFEMGIRDLSQGELTYPGVIQQILTTPVRGLDNYQEMMRLLCEGKHLKVFVEVADD